MKNAIYNFFGKLEEWTFEGPAFICLGKFLLVGCLFLFGSFFLVGTIVNLVNPHEHAVLDLTSDFFCAESHTEMQWVHHGKTSSYEPVTTCDVYKRK
jgi:hypothetical protein